MFVMMVLLKMDIELDAADVGFLAVRGMDVPAGEIELVQPGFQLFEAHAEIEQRAKQHVAADPAEDIEVKGFHFALSTASALIWLAA
jgi:hypothetical protein